MNFSQIFYIKTNEKMMQYKYAKNKNDNAEDKTKNKVNPMKSQNRLKETNEKLNGLLFE